MLTTRCPGCNTSFRLSESQRHAAHGWVRCGRCQEVFHAEGELKDLESVLPIPDASLPPPQAPAPAPVSRPSEPEAPLAAAATTTATAGAAVSADTSTRFVWESDRLATPLARPQRRALWTVLAVLGAVALALQAAMLWRQELAATSPQLRSALKAGCEFAGCTVQPLRRLESLRVESSELRQVEGTVYQLQVVVRNTSAESLQWPAVDFSVTDAGLQVMARRALMPSELSVQAPTIAPGQEASLQARLSTGERAASGFTIELFYP